MPAPITSAYISGVKYLFKTGFNSYVLGTITEITDTEITLKDARLQIPPNKIEKFMERIEPMSEQAVHLKMVINRVTVDWAVPVK